VLFNQGLRGSEAEGEVGRFARLMAAVGHLAKGSQCRPGKDILPSSPRLRLILLSGG
jgi:hypothetical protein